MTRLVRWLLALGSVVLVALPAGATVPAELLIVRSEGFFPPNEMVVEGKLTGIHIDLISAVAANLNIEVKFVSFPWKRAIQMLEKGEADAISYMGKTPEREQFGLFEEGNRLGVTQNGFFMLRNSATQIRYSGDLQQLKAHAVGTIRGRVYSAAFDQASFITKDDQAQDETQLLRKLLARRFDIAIGHVSRMTYFSQQSGAEPVVFLKPLFAPIHNYLVFSKAKKHEVLARRFAASMAAFKESAKFRDLLKKYDVSPENF